MRRILPASTVIAVVAAIAVVAVFRLGGSAAGVKAAEVRVGEAKATDGKAAEVQAPRAPARTPDCVYVGTPYDVIDRMLDLASIQSDEVVYDLGCGDARILVAAARRHGCRCVGYDINPVRVEEALDNAREHGVESLVKIEEKDIFTVDLKPASAILIYLLPKMNERLIPQIQKLAPGSRIVCHDYSIKGMVPEKTVTVTSLEDGVNHEIFVYRAPLKREP